MQITLEVQLQQAIDKADATIAENETLLAAYRAECYEAGYSAFLRGDAGQYEVGRNRFWYAGFQAAEDAAWAEQCELDGIGRDESLYPWLY